MSRNRPQNLRDWGVREEIAHAADVALRGYIAELRDLGATQAANALARARKSIQGCERHARRMVSDMRRDGATWGYAPCGCTRPQPGFAQRHEPTCRTVRDLKPAPPLGSRS